MKIAFISGPYRGKSKWAVIRFFQVIRNIIRARKYAAKYTRMGYFTICPHMNTALFEYIRGAPDDSVWLNGYLEVIEAFKGHPGFMMVIIPGWSESDGTCLEKMKAHDSQIPTLIEDYK